VEENKERHPGGRPSVLNDKIKEIMLNLAPMGMSNKEIADVIGVSDRTIYRWLEENPEFCHTYNNEKLFGDAKVTQAMYKAACGDVVTVETHEGVDATGNVIDKKVTKQHKPDITAAKFWLTNRQPDKWKEKVETTIKTDDNGLKLSYDLNSVDTKSN
jgi:hypothetical protein